MISASDLAGLRATSLAALPDTCTIARKALTGTTDATGSYTPDAPTSIYSGVCRLRPPDTAEIRVLAGDEQVTRQRYVLTIAHDAAEVLVDDIVSVTVSSDAVMLARPFRVIGRASGSWLIDRRLIVEATE